jgi:hypothetical protein
MKPLDLIKKLLRLNRSSNLHEAALALQKAREIASLHRIDLKLVNPDEEWRAVTHRDIMTDKRLAVERKYASIIVQTFFRVSCVFVPKAEDQSHLTMIGTATDLEVANYVYVFLVRHFRFCWRHHRGRLRNRVAFMRGLFVGLYSKLDKAQPPVEDHAITISHATYKRHLFPHGLVPHRCPKPFRNSQAFHAGYIQGQQTEIRSGIRSTIPATLEIKNAPLEHRQFRQPAGT